MIVKRISTACIAATLAIVPVGEAAASDGLVGGIVGGIIGGAIVNHANRQPQRVQRVQRNAPQRSTVSSATREANRQTQVALNYFGFPAGTPDGVIGRNSRAAIANYQAFMGYPPSGQLNQFERDFLVTSYNRASIGGPHIAQMVATNPQGVRGLLHAFRDEMMGTSVAAQPVPQVAPQVPLAVVAPAAAAPLAVVAPQPEPDPTPAPSAGLPNFMASPGSQASLASHCNRVSLLTNSNGGFTTLASMTDPGFALEEQFCLARTYAIAQGEELVAKVQGFTPQQIAQQCDAFGPAMKDHVASLSLKPQAEVMEAVGAFILQSGMAPAQLAGTAKICLSVGYRTDDMDVAVGSALLLAVLGERVYAELMGHHLAQGFGASKRPDLALAWYDMGLDAISTGSNAVFVPGHADRGDLIRAAAYAVGGRAMPSAPVVEQAPVPAGLPVFDLGSAAKDVKN